MIRTALLACLLAVLAACTGTRPLPAPPEDLYETAAIRDFGDIRDWGDVVPADRDARIDEWVEQIERRVEREGQPPGGLRLDSLVLSGGGSDGPFGAGLLVGWTARGDRPEFTIVTGISAGALIAPFAFLGPDYDETLRRFTVEGSTDTLVTFRILRGILDGVGLIDNSKLRQKLRGLITEDVVRAIAGEWRRGRRLLIGTTNLDAQRPVYWRVGEIAAKGLDEPARTADLITRIIVASASIPGAFPPQFFTVSAGGELYTEMHVDGGVTNQLFFLPADAEVISRLPARIRRMVGSGTVYVIRNTVLTPDYAPVEPGIVQIGSRAISTLIKFGGQSDIRILEERARSAGYGVKVAAVPDSFDMEADELFDPAYMQALYGLGRRMTEEGDPWETTVEPVLMERQVASGAVDRRRP